jgi:hypothetical protein
LDVEADCPCGVERDLQLDSGLSVLKLAQNPAVDADHIGDLALREAEFLAAGVQAGAKVPGRCGGANVVHLRSNGNNSSQNSILRSINYKLFKQELMLPIDYIRLKDAGGIIRRCCSS